MFTIDISALKSGVHTFALEPEAEALDLDPAKIRHIRVGVRLDVQEGRILAMMNARATATLECDRTLRLFEQEIAGAFSVLFVPASFVGDGEATFDEVRVLDPADQEIDLTAPVRDTLLLAIPQRCLAPGAEDEDIPTEFGVPEDRIDPRWEALRKLK